MSLSQRTDVYGDYRTTCRRITVRQTACRLFYQINNRRATDIKNKRYEQFYWMVIGLLLGLVNLRAEIKLPALVSDNMVLQQATKVRLWGNATPNSSLKVRSSWDNTEYTAQVNDQGRWEIWVQTPSASFEKQQLTLKNGQDKIVLHDLLIGEVWFGSGQSNMEMPLRGFWHWPYRGRKPRYRYIREI